MPKVTVWIGEKHYRAAKEHALNLSQLLREAIEQATKDKIPDPDYFLPDLLVQVRCPYCGAFKVTGALSATKCDRCKRVFRIYTRKYGTRIVKIVRGDQQLLQERLARVHNLKVGAL